ncbi:hypothetical protein SADUNF_Sadunf03G0089300 [Salix dunnii]|uniref:Uncharacterized protein n=1 Tax=Salix dunnii TaxID=1413687 RepID=A0A835N3E2_9ROSI|nr:hypothetical protein SADUNF_Sadunf03G0089300 [Salix dunnii]
MKGEDQASNSFLFVHLGFSLVISSMAFMSYGWYFIFVQGFVCLVLIYLVLIYLQGFNSKQMVNPWKTYWKLFVVLIGSHGLTKRSLAFLNYPAQIMFKSTKVLPVMIEKKTFSSRIHISLAPDYWFDPFHFGRCLNISQFLYIWRADDFWCFNYGFFDG